MFIQYAIIVNQITVCFLVEEVLSTTNIKVAVYNGQLDFIVCTPGTYAYPYQHFEVAYLLAIYSFHSNETRTITRFNIINDF